MNSRVVDGVRERVVDGVAEGAREIVVDDVGGLDLVVETGFGVADRVERSDEEVVLEVLTLEVVTEHLGVTVSVQVLVEVADPFTCKLNCQ